MGEPACLTDFQRRGSAFETPVRPQFGPGWTLVTAMVTAVALGLLVWPAWRLQAVTLRNDRDVKTFKDAIDPSQLITPKCAAGVGAGTQRIMPHLRLGKFYPIRFCDRRRDLVLGFAQDPNLPSSDEDRFTFKDGRMPIYILIADGAGDPLRQALSDVGLRGDMFANSSVRYLCVGEIGGTACAKTPALPPERVIEAIPIVLAGRDVPNLSEGGVSAFFDARPDSKPSETERKFAIAVRAQSRRAR